TRSARRCFHSDPQPAISMTQIKEEVLERVREELARRPNLAPGVLYHMALQIEPSISQQSMRAFHARYIAPIQHELAAAQRRTRKPRKDRKRPSAEPREPEAAVDIQQQERVAAPEVLQVAPEPERQNAVSRARRSPRQPRRVEIWREQIRLVFLQFARELAGAETRAEIVQALSRLDRYIDQVVQHSR
ncbi:MAG TPA: hypothetical protein VGR27_08605, partial [Longimicrobiaceae bacterium]|nr:hypothetical protein [Longimicrobiaceae bacterium]